MVNHSSEAIKKHIKTHTVRSNEDRSAVAVLESFLRSNGKINHSFATDDKWPNHDGTFEFVSDPDISRAPQQTFYVQIKGTSCNYSENDGAIKYYLKDLAFPAFICDKVSYDPGILFVVLNPEDKGNERIFWKYMSEGLLNSIDFNKNSITINFSSDEEIKYNDESVYKFCDRIEKIIELHSFISSLKRDSYTISEVKNIILACSKEITESIDNLNILNQSRDNISKRILTRLDDLCVSALLLNAINNGFEHPTIPLAWELSILNVETKYLANFYKGLQYIGRRIPDEGQSERLLLKYYNFMWQIRKFLKESYNISILENLENFQEYTEIDELDKQYYELISKAFDDLKYGFKKWSDTRFYIQKKTPFYIGTERYFEITLQQADAFASKYNRITAYTKQNISTSYSIQIEYFPSSINLWGVDTEIKLITSWRVSIDSRCLNKLARILNNPTKISTNYGEYDRLMQFLTKTGMNFLEMIDLKEMKFSDIIDRIYQNANTSYFKNILERLQKDYSFDSNKFGKHTIRYILLNLREELLERIMPSQFSSQWKCEDLYLSRKCYPFEKNPIISDLAGSKTNSIDKASHIANVVEKELTDIALPYWSIIKNTQETGEVYCDLNDNVNYESISEFNNNLDSWELQQGYGIKIENNVACINSFENSTLYILKQLLDFSHLPNKGQKEFNERYIKDSGIHFSDVDKEKAIKNAFVNSRVLLIYGAAGTGKTTLINMLSTMLSNRKKLFLTKTHTALQNLQRRIDNPGLDSSFVSIDSFTKKISLVDYDVIFVDECSTIDNRIMKNFLSKISNDTLLVFAGDIYQIESIDFGNWFTYAKNIITTPGANVELSSTWRTKDKNLISLWDEVRMNGEIITEKLVIDGPFSENIGENIFNRETEDEVILCLNYDGKFGLNNMNNYFQNANPSKPVIWNDWKYKIGDRILFNDTNRFSLLYNNLKGTIVNIEKFENKIFFTVDVETPLTEMDCKSDDIEFIDIVDNGTRIRFDVIAPYEEMPEDIRECTIIPFQLAYAVSIHKAQGLEYSSVKVVIPSNIVEKITHGIFYTAITRAKDSLKIYWDKTTMNNIVESFSKTDSTQKSLEIIKEKLII